MIFTRLLEEADEGGDGLEDFLREMEAFGQEQPEARLRTRTMMR